MSTKQDQAHTVEPADNDALKHHETRRYVTIPAFGSIDAAIDMLVDKYDVAVPLADLLYCDPYAVVTK